jgi:lipopolysaccharide/colanic/teichoic acid biosynthesis glycosyltransferase
MEKEKCDQQWFAVRVRSRCEKAVTMAVRQKGFEAFLPVRKSGHREAPVFPGYVFCRFDPKYQLALLKTPGVLDFVEVPIPASEIEAIETAVRSELGTELDPDPESGHLAIRKTFVAHPEPIHLSVTKTNTSSAMWNIRSLNKRSKSKTKDFFPLSGSTSELLAEKPFVKRLHVEQKRTERSGRRFILLLLDCSALMAVAKRADTAETILLALMNVTRETDIKGWYKEGLVIGVIFTEVASANEPTAVKVLLGKVSSALSGALTSGQAKLVGISVHIFPEDWHQKGSGSSETLKLHPDLVRDRGSTKALWVKRLTDVIGSLIALIVFSPIFIAIALAVKLSSKGPVLFYQFRIGKYGRKFKFLKFRSMYTENNSSIHEEYVKRLISGGTGSEPSGTQQHPVYKLTHDPRITPLGKILRRSSFDEFPQFLNVLKGEMSLVGPRPAIAYEVECYDLWHKQRLLSVKPGITGLWQVNGRSRIRFDDMVRLDLKYAHSWSLWLDIKILLRTPRAMFTCDGAY